MRKTLLSIAAAMMSLTITGQSFASTGDDLVLPVRPRNAENIYKAPVRKNAVDGDPILRVIPPTPFQGVLIGCTSWDISDPQVGLYNFSATAPERSLIYQNSTMGTVYGTLIYDGKLFTMNWFDLFGATFTEVIIFDLSTGETVTDIAQVDKNLSSTSLAYDKETGKIYGSFVNYTRNCHEFGVLDTNTMTRSTISTLPGYLYGLSFTPDGRLVGLNPRTGNLYNVNKEDGTLTLIGQTGITSKYVTSGAVCPRSGYMYFAVCNDDECALYRIDTNTAEAVKLYDFPDEEEIMGMYIPDAPYADMVPGQALSLEPVFEGLELSGTVNFKAPEETFNGTEGEGDLKFHLYSNGTLVKESAVAWGEEVSVPYELTEPEYCTFRLTFSNETGEGPAVEKSVFIGESLKPGTVETVTLEIEGTTQKISWTPVTSMFYGGDFDASKLTYKVVRNLDEAVVATGLTETEYTDNFAEPGEMSMLSYSVIAVYQDTEGDPMASEELVYGYVTPAYKETFHKDRIPYVEKWTVVDADGDGVLNWTHDSSGGRIRTKANATSRDIYATPRVYLEPDRIYTVKYGVSSYSSSKSAFVSCWLSDSLEPASFTRCLAEGAEVITSSKTTFEYFTGEFSVDEAGFYYLGLKNEGGTGTYNYVDNFEIKTPALTAAPAAPSDFTAVPDPDGNKEVQLSFTMPKKTAGDKNLTDLTGYEVKRGSTRVARVTSNVRTGETYTFTDTPDKTGKTEYTVTAFNSAGHGIAARATVYVGINVPGVVEGVTIAEPEEGYVKLTWTAPATDRDGYPINPAHVKYNILDMNRDYIADNLTDTEYTVYAVSPGRHSFLYFYVQTESEGGESEFIVQSPMLAVGTPFPMPYNESFADGAVKTQWATVNYTGSIPSTWSVVKEIPEFPSADDDGGFVMSHSDDAGGKVALQSPKLKLDSEYPTLTFRYFAIPGSHNIIEPRVALPGGDFEALDSITVSQTGELGWQKVIIPLEKYAGQTVRLELLATCVNNSQTHFDAISIANCNPVDLAIEKFDSPEKMETWKDNSFELIVTNIGRSAIDGAKAQLLLGDELKDEVALDNLEDGDAMFVTLKHKPTIHDAATLDYKVVIAAEGDNDESNNVAEVTVPLALPTFPTVKKISHTMDEEGLVLSWEAPEAATEDYDGTALDLTGYRVYRNGEFMTETSDPTLEEKNLNEGDRIEYKVSAVYNLGESVLSDPYTVSYSGINGATGSVITVRGDKGAIIITGALGLNAVLTNAAAQTNVYAVNSDNFVIEVAPGVYMITLNGTTEKVLVK